MVEGTGLGNMVSMSSFCHLRSLNVRHFGVIDVTLNVITSIQNVIQIHQSVQKLLRDFTPISEV
jgi:hypothetical protein